MSSLTLLPNPVLINILKHVQGYRSFIHVYECDDPTSCVHHNRERAIVNRSVCFSSSVLSPLLLHSVGTALKFNLLSNFLMYQSKRLKKEFQNKHNLALLEWAVSHSVHGNALGEGRYISALCYFYQTAAQKNKTLALRILRTFTCTVTRRTLLTILQQNQYDMFMETLRRWKLSPIKENEVSTARVLGGTHTEVYGEYCMWPHYYAVTSKRADVREAIQEIFQVSTRDLLMVALGNLESETDTVHLIRQIPNLDFYVSYISSSLSACTFTVFGIDYEFDVQIPIDTPAAREILKQPTLGCIVVFPAFFFEESFYNTLKELRKLVHEDSLFSYTLDRELGRYARALGIKHL